MAVDIFYGVLCFAVATLATACSVLVTPRRTYYPLLRLIFAAQALVYGTLGAATLWGTAGDPRLRLWVTGALVLALAGCIWFIARRNKYPQWLNPGWAGPVPDVDPAEIEDHVLATLSLIRHGAATPETVDQAREAIAQYDALTRWKWGMLEQARRRHAEKEQR